METRPQARICYDVRYDGERVLIYDSRGAIEDTFTACLYRGTKEIVKKAGGTHIYPISETEMIVINPVKLNHLTSITDWRWFVMDSILRSRNIEVFTAWLPVYIATGGTTGATIAAAPDTPIVVPPRAQQQIFVVPCIKSRLYITEYNSHPIVPLLETIIHIHQEFSGMSLCQVGIAMNRGFDPSFNDPSILMRFLFEFFRPEFIELCSKENTPLHKLHKSNFNLLFDHNLSRTNSASLIRVVKNLKMVFLVPLSLFFSNMSCGDIPWIMADQPKKLEVEKRAKAIAYPLGFFENIGKISSMREAVFYHRVSVLPEIVVEERTYPAGGIIGIIEREDKSIDTVYRGELFEDITLREEMILNMIYRTFLGGDLSPNDNCGQFLKNSAFNQDQIAVRAPFIKAIQATLCRASLPAVPVRNQEPVPAPVEISEEQAFAEPPPVIIVPAVPESENGQAG